MHLRCALLLSLLACTPGEGLERSETTATATPEPAEAVAPSSLPASEPAEPSEPADAPEPELFTPATRGTGNCEVTVSALLEAQEYRGPGPITPAVAASLDADPDYAKFYNSESHGDHHIQCVYQVELAGSTVHYRWRTFFSNTLRHSTTKACNGLAGSVAQDIVQTTKECSDFEAGAYWGYVLEPMP